MKAFLIIMPFLTNIIYKLAAAFINPQLMAATLQDIASLPKPSSNLTSFNEGQRKVILSRLSYTSYLSTVIATTILSLLSAAVLLIAKGTGIVGIFIYLILLMFAALTITWVVRRKATLLVVSGNKRLIPTFLLCIYDLLLCALSLWVQLRPVNIPTGTN
jgi:hypothetical protein